jgi:hypothetical protein
MLGQSLATQQIARWVGMIRNEMPEHGGAGRWPKEALRFSFGRGVGRLGELWTGAVTESIARQISTPEYYQ